MDIKRWFGVRQRGDGSYELTANREFDRELKKQFIIPIRICDHEKLCATSDLTLTIGDVNDNPMESGSSEIFVYNYEGQSPATQIGRVYVSDPDDWDLPDKVSSTSFFSRTNKYFFLCACTIFLPHISRVLACYPLLIHDSTIIWYFPWYTHLIQQDFLKLI